MANEVVYLVLKIVVILAVTIVTRYLIPWIKEKIGNEQYDRIEKEVTKFVLAIQQMYPELAGPEKRKIVTEKIIEYLASKNIELTNDQIRDLIESAVKTMKIQESNNG